jgi:hypothetical protein
VVIALECEGKVHGPRHDLDECHLIIARQDHEEEEEEDLKRPKYSSQNDAKREDTCYTTLTNTHVHASPYGLLFDRLSSAPSQKQKRSLACCFC